MNQEQRSTLQQKFFSDPDWKIVEGMIRERLSNLVDPAKIPKETPAEEYKARMLTALEMKEQMEIFLADAKILAKVESKPTTFR